MTRAEAIARLRSATDRRNTQAQGRAYREAKAATERVLSKPRLARWWDRVIDGMKGVK